MTFSAVLHQYCVSCVVKEVPGTLFATKLIFIIILLRGDSYGKSLLP